MIVIVSELVNFDIDAHKNLHMRKTVRVKHIFLPTWLKY